MFLDGEENVKLGDFGLATSKKARSKVVADVGHKVGTSELRASRLCLSVYRSMTTLRPSTPERDGALAFLEHGRFRVPGRTERLSVDLDVDLMLMLILILMLLLILILILILILEKICFWLTVTNLGIREDLDHALWSCGESRFQG